MRVEIPEGFRFVSYPVLTVQYSDREVLASSEMQIVLAGVTSKPQKRQYYSTYGSGYLEYQFTPSTTTAQITRISFTVDEVPYHGSTGVLANAIKVSAIKDGVLINQATMDVKQAGPTVKFGHGHPEAMDLLADTGSVTTTRAYCYRFHDHQYQIAEGLAYSKSQEVFYYYPKELTVIGTQVGGNYSSYTYSIDTT